MAYAMIRYMIVHDFANDMLCSVIRCVVWCDVVWYDIAQRPGEALQNETRLIVPI